MQQAQVQQSQPLEKKRISLRGFFNSPYVLVLLPLLAGSFYLVLNPQYVVMAVNYPFAWAFVLAIPVALFTGKLVLNFFSVIEQWIRLQFEKARSAKKSHFFEIVTAVFMFVSVCEAGPFFNDIQHNVLGGALGYITVLAFDLIAVVCIDARRKELAKGGSKAGVYLSGVIVCALVSMVANLYSALLNFQPPTVANFPEFLKSIAPYVGIMFPFMIVFLAFSRDAEIEIDDAEAYKKQQQKRVDFLKARREILAGVLHEMEQIALLGKREFFLKSWLFTTKKMNLVIETVTAKVMELVNAEIKTLKDEIARKEQTITSQVQAMQILSREMKELSVVYSEQCKTVAGQMQQITHLKETLEQQITTLASQKSFDVQEINKQIQFAQDETIRIIQTQLTDITSFERSETEDETFDENEEEIDGRNCDTDPSLPAVTTSETDGATNITFLQNSRKTKNETSVRTKSARGSAAKKAATIIKNKPDITPAELAKRAKITPTYARKLLAKQTLVSETV